MFRFSIRDVLWLTAVFAVGVSLGLAWWREHELARVANENLRSARQAQSVFEADARDLGDMQSPFGQRMTDERAEELRKKYIEKRWTLSQ